MAEYQEIRKNNGNNFSFLVNPDKLIQDNTLNIDILAFEKALDDHFKCRLSSIPLGGGHKYVKTCTSLIKHYSNYGVDSDLFSTLGNNIFDGDLKPSAMLYKNAKELKKSIFMMFQLSYAHYILGLNNCMKNQFPNYYCGHSSNNLLTALWEAGIAPAVQSYNSQHDHCYITVPFVIEESNTKGILLVDPTSDQLINDYKKKIRNNIMIKPEKGWTYITDWRNGANLYPTRVEASICYGWKFINYDEYIEKALKNPVVIV